MSKYLLLVIGCATAATIAGAAAVGVIGAPPSVDRATASPTGPATDTTRRAASGLVLRATPTPTRPVTLVLTSVDRQPSLGGITLTVVIENQQAAPLSFAFDPSYDLTMVDARGNPWALRWAEYTGSPTVAAGASAQLVRAFFAGPVASSSVWPLTLSVERAPLIGRVTWTIAARGTSPPSVDAAGPRLPVVTPSGAVSLRLANPRPSSGLGGIQVDLLIRNSRSTDLVFRFDPGAQLTAEDNLGRPYHVRWAQYGGTVHLRPHAAARLARVFFEGPIADSRASWLSVQLHQVPGAGVLTGVVPLS